MLVASWISMPSLDLDITFLAYLQSCITFLQVCKLMVRRKITSGRIASIVLDKLEVLFKVMRLLGTERVQFPEEVQRRYSLKLRLMSPFRTSLTVTETIAMELAKMK